MVLPVFSTHAIRKLERYFQERQEKIEILNTLKENKSGDVNNEYIENVQINIDYLSKCIEETQNAIMQLEDDHININQLFNNMDPDEVMYIMDKLANSAINYAILSSQRDDELKEKDAKLNTLLSENMYSNHLLNYMVSKNFVRIEGWWCEMHGCGVCNYVNSLCGCSCGSDVYLFHNPHPFFFFPPRSKTRMASTQLFFQSIRSIPMT